MWFRAASPTRAPILALTLGCLMGLPQISRAEDPWYRSYEKGLEAVESGNWEEAARLLSLAIADGPVPGRRVRTYGVRFVDFLPGYYLAVAAYNLGQYDEAAQRLEEVFESRVIKEGDEEFPAAEELLARTRLALRARGVEASSSIAGAEPSADTPSSDGLRGAVAVTSAAPAYSRGRYVALAIGNEDYEHFPHLETPIEDAGALADLLARSYGFETRVIENASRADILDSIDDTMSNLSEHDSLLIFYAGHGILDDESNEGYWLPVTAQPDRRSEWLSNSEIRNILRRSPAKHVLVIADSCFSGTLTRAVRVGRQFDMDLDRYYQKLASQKSRTALTSGGLEPVDDGGGGGHSIFASSLLRALESNSEPILEAEMLHSQISRDVVLNSTSGQQPLYSDVRNTGHENGDFLFIRLAPPEQH